MSEGRVVKQMVKQSVTRRRALLLGAATLALGVAMQRADGIADASPLACGVPPREPLPFPLPDPAVPWSAPSGSVPTSVELSAAGFEYRVDGRPTFIKGMGYNPPIGGLPLDARRQRFDVDLPLMAAAGVNTVIGWNPAVFDGALLDAAHRSGLGVTLPFDIDFTQDVRDSATRQSFTSTILRWVDQYRAHPAVRFWAVGNEVLQRAVPPAWCSTAPSEIQGAWADAWSTLLVEVADRIHERDPDHPVLYREAEDSYAPWLARALAARPVPRPWLVYGVNAYTPRLVEIIDGWPDRQIPTSLLVSEFAPLNGARGERADAFREIWGAIRTRSSQVLGGAVYVWSTDGPEEVDRAFGLVDSSGEPVDDALETIASLYHEGDGTVHLEGARTAHLDQNGAEFHAMSSGRHAVATASGNDARARGGGADGRAGVGAVLS